MLEPKTESDWVDFNTGDFITSIETMPDDTIGFVYLLEYENEIKYIGCKNIYSETNKPIRLDRKERENCTGLVKKRRNGKLEVFEVIKKESNWKTYNGSHKTCKNKTPIKKYILAYAKTKLQLTYLETQALFTWQVLETDKFINDNILGKFYRNRLDFCG